MGTYGKGRRRKDELAVFGGQTGGEVKEKVLGSNIELLSVQGDQQRKERAVKEEVTSKRTSTGGTAKSEGWKKARLRKNLVRRES